MLFFELSVSTDKKSLKTECYKRACASQISASAFLDKAINPSREPCHITANLSFSAKRQKQAIKQLMLSLECCLHSSRRKKHTPMSSSE